MDEEYHHRWVGEWAKMMNSDEASEGEVEKTDVRRAGAGKNTNLNLP